MTDLLRLGGGEADRLATAPFVALPLGSIEYHGPHAPLGSDTTLAAGFARRIADESGALLLPPIAYTFAPVITSRWRGTLSVSPEVFLAYLSEVLLALARGGAQRILLLNGHSENQYAARLAGERLALAEPAASLLLVNWWKLVDTPPETFSERGGHGHGGPLEISTVAGFDPGGVDPALAANIPYEAPWWRSAAQIVGRGQAPLGFDGYHGRVDEISAERGAAIIEGVMVNLRQLVRDWLDRAASDPEV